MPLKSTDTLDVTIVARWNDYPTENLSRRTAKGRRAGEEECPGYVIFSLQYQFALADIPLHGDLHGWNLICALSIHAARYFPDEIRVKCPALGFSGSTAFSTWTWNLFSLLSVFFLLFVKRWARGERALWKKWTCPLYIIEFNIEIQATLYFDIAHLSVVSCFPLVLERWLLHIFHLCPIVNSVRSEPMI